LPINTYDETHASDYLEVQRLELAKLRAQKIGQSVIIPGYILPLADTVNLSDSLPAPTEVAKGTFELTGDNADQKLFLTFEYDTQDGSNNANHGVVSGTETYIAGPEPSPNKLDIAFDFNGSSQIDIPNESNFDRTNTQVFSVSFWAKWTTGSIMMLVTKMTATANQGIEIGSTASGALRIRLINTATTNEIDVITTATYKNGVWRHFSVTKSTASLASGVKLYVDSIDTSLTVTTDNLVATIANNVAVSIGAYNGGTSRFTGQITDVQWWNLQHSAADVLDLVEGKQLSKNAVVSPALRIALGDVAA